LRGAFITNTPYRNLRVRFRRLRLLETQVEEEAMVIIAIFGGIVLVGGVFAGLKSLVYSSEKPRDHFNVL
jgi:hypothetical protein